MRNLLKESLEGKEDEICNEIMRFMVKNGINNNFKEKTFLRLCVADTNNGILNPCDENIKVIAQNIGLRIVKTYNKDDLLDKVYDFIKCIENGYRSYLLDNIEDKKDLKSSIILIDQFFYNYEKHITKNSRLTNETNFFIKKDEINLLIDSIPAIIILKDENEKWIFANRYAEKFYGLKDGYINKTDRELSEENKYIKESISSQHKRNIWTSNKSYFYEESITKNNKKMFLFVTEVPMIFENGNKVIIVIKKDVTRDKVAKEKIYQGESNYIKIFDNISDAVFICKSNKILYLNKRAIEIIGHSGVESLIGKDCNSLLEISPKFIEYGKYTARRLVYSGEGIEISSTIKRKSDGKVFDMRMLSIPFLYENQNTILTVATNNDAKDSMTNYGKSKSEFIGKISHELRTPLNVILSALQVIALYDGCKDLGDQCKAYKKYYYMIKQNSYRLLRIVNNFMDVNEIEDGVSELNFTRENIVSIVEDVTMAAAEFINHKGKNIVFDTDIEEKIMLVDKDGIQKVVLNLLSNAIKFTDKFAKIEVNVHNDNDNDNVIISVKDNGIGIPKNKQKIIFERFVQLDKTFTRRREGSGMGLLIVKMIVKLHNGWITVKSEPGEGSEFIVTLPVLDSKKFESNHQENIIKYSSDEKVNLEFSDLML